jgi:two-component system nitrate/nitrite response regulator NarL
MIAVAPSRAEGAAASSREAGVRLTYVLVIDAEHQAEADVLIAQIPGASFYTIRSSGDRPAELPAGQLSPRLEQVLRLVGEGMSNKAIGRQLGISHFTVRNHVARLLRIYKVRNRDELIALMQSSQPA